MITKEGITESWLQEKLTHPVPSPILVHISSWARAHDVFALFQNGRHYGVLSFSFKLHLAALFLNFPLHEATRANLQANKKILKWQQFESTMYGVQWHCDKTNVLNLARTSLIYLLPWQSSCPSTFLHQPATFECILEAVKNSVNGLA